MRLPKFEYLAPETVKEACSLLSQYKGEAKPIAGGTDLLIGMKHRVVTPSYLVSLEHIPNLDYINQDGKEGVRIGVLTTLHALETSPIIQEKFPILAQAANRVASPQIRNRGTIGGNICLDVRCWYYNQSRSWRRSRPPCYKTGGDRCYVVKGGNRCYALFSADTVPALIGLGAKIKVAGSGGERLIALDEFYTGVGETVVILQPDELLTEVQVPNQPPHTGGIYLKHSLREAVDFGIVGVAAMITLDAENRTCIGARIAFSGISSAPIRALKAEGELQGKEIENDLIGKAAEVAVKEATPIVPIGASVSYKRRMVEVFVKRAVKQAWEVAKSA